MMRPVCISSAFPLAMLALSPSFSATACSGGPSSPSAGADASKAGSQNDASAQDGGEESDSAEHGDSWVNSDAPAADTANDDTTPSPTTCPSGRGAPMVMIRAGDASPPLCMDVTEVTNAAYADFLADAGSNTTQSAACATVNTSFEPNTVGACAGLFDPMARANLPIVCVDWCDAQAFCSWAGKSLCGDVMGGPASSLSDAAWTFACSNGSTSMYEYGPAYVPGTCNDSEYSQDGGLIPVASDPSCHGTRAPYDMVFDLEGNAAEFQDNGCPSGNCLAIGGSYQDFRPSCSPVPVTLSNQAVYPYLGFRCCASL